MACIFVVQYFKIKRAIKNLAADIMVTSKALIDEQKNSATPLSTARYKVTYDLCELI